MREHLIERLEGLCDESEIGPVADLLHSTRARLAALYAYYRSTMFAHTGMASHLAETPSYEDRQDVLALPALVMAVIDGMSLQVNLDPAAVDCDRVFALLDLLVSEVLEGRVHTQGQLSPPAS